MDFSPDKPDEVDVEEETKKRLVTNREAINGAAIAAAKKRGRSALRNGLFVSPSSTGTA